MKSKPRKKPDVTKGWDQMYDPTEFAIDPRTTILQIACCDCGSTHTHDIEVLKNGNIHIKMKKEYAITAALRKKERYLRT